MIDHSLNQQPLTLKAALDELSASDGSVGYLEEKIITALTDDNAKLREALADAKGLEIFPKGSLPYEAAKRKRDETLAATDPETRVLP